MSGVGSLNTGSEIGDLLAEIGERAAFAGRSEYEQLVEELGRLVSGANGFAERFADLIDDRAFVGDRALKLLFDVLLGLLDDADPDAIIERLLTPVWEELSCERVTEFSR
jgi:hypothetical protein